MKTELIQLPNKKYQLTVSDATRKQMDDVLDRLGEVYKTQFPFPR